MEALSERMATPEGLHTTLRGQVAGPLNNQGRGMALATTSYKSGAPDPPWRCPSSGAGPRFHRHTPTAMLCGQWWSRKTAAICQAGSTSPKAVSRSRPAAYNGYPTRWPCAWRIAQLRKTHALPVRREAEQLPGQLLDVLHDRSPQKAIEQLESRRAEAQRPPR